MLDEEVEEIMKSEEDLWPKPLQTEWGRMEKWKDVKEVTPPPSPPAPKSASSSSSASPSSSPDTAKSRGNVKNYPESPHNLPPDAEAELAARFAKMAADKQKRKDQKEARARKQKARAAAKRKAEREETRKKAEGEPLTESETSEVQAFLDWMHIKRLESKPWQEDL